MTERLIWSDLIWYKKDLHDPDNHDGVITHVEPDILEYEVKWGLGSITMNKASGILVELFQILKDDTVKVLHSIYQQIWNTQQWPRDWKRSVFIPIPKKGNAKECLKYCTIALIPHASKVKWHKVTQSCLTLCDPMDYSLPGFSIHGIFQAKVPEWVAISFSRGSSQPRNWTWLGVPYCRQMLYPLSHQGCG